MTPRKPPLKNRLEVILFTLEEEEPEAEKLLSPPVRKQLAGCQHGENPYATLQAKLWADKPAGHPDTADDLVVGALKAMHEGIAYIDAAIKCLGPAVPLAPVDLKLARVRQEDGSAR